MKSALITLLLALPVAAQGLHWEQNLDAAKKRAQAEHKVIFLDLWAEWCGPCLALKKNVFPDPAVQTALKNVIPLEMVVEKKDRTPLSTGVAMARLLNLRAFPTLFILDAQGNLLRRHEGYLSPEELTRFLQEP